MVPDADAPCGLQLELVGEFAGLMSLGQPEQTKPPLLQRAGRKHWLREQDLGTVSFKLENKRLELLHEFESSAFHLIARIQRMHPRSLNSAGCQNRLNLIYAGLSRQPVGTVRELGFHK